VTLFHFNAQLLFLLTHPSASRLSLSLPSFLPSSTISLFLSQPPPMDFTMPQASLILNIIASFSFPFHVFRSNSVKVEISTNLGFWDSFSTFNEKHDLLIFQSNIDPFASLQSVFVCIDPQR
jgi:hypothetical protein